MSRYTGPRVRQMRALGTALPGLSRKSIERRPYPPGQHGSARKPRPSDFAVRLLEKQKVRRYYGVTERQLRNLVIEASRGAGTTYETLLELLERRLDNIVFRAGFARTIPAARQMVTHGHVSVNDRRVDIASYRVRTGDVVSLRGNTAQNAHVAAAMTDTSIPGPAWLERTESPLQALVRDRPDPSQLLFEVQPQLVIEYYSTRL